MTAREELQSATRNSYKAQLNNIWNIIDRVELTDDEQDEINTCMAWVREDLESFHYGGWAKAMEVTKWTRLYRKFIGKV
jgi:hypothetical protein